MKTSTKPFALACAALLLAACAEENEPPAARVAARVTAGVSGPRTRAVDNLWNADRIGVAASSGGAAMEAKYRNVEYATESTGAVADFTPATAGGGIFFEDAGAVSAFSAYAPYSPSADRSVLPGTGGKIAVNTSSQPTATAQEAVDYIYASGATAGKDAPAISFTDNTASGGADCSFKHRMARLVLKVKTSNTDGFGAANVLEFADYRLGGLVHEGEFDVTTGTAAATGEPVADWMPRACTGDGSARTASDNCVASYDAAAGEMTLTMILLPQTLADNLAFAVSPYDGEGQTYANTTAIRPELKAGYTYTYTVTAKKTGLEVGGCTIADWNEGGGGTGDALMQ